MEDLGPKAGFRKQKRQQGMLAFPGPGVILPNQYYTLGVTFCQEKKWELGRERNGGEESKPAASAKPSGAQETRLKAKARNFKDPTRPDPVGVNAPGVWATQIRLVALRPGRPPGKSETGWKFHSALVLPSGQAWEFNAANPLSERFWVSIPFR
jgi:hypothetical protein